jgi:hypothetical protein
MYVHQRWSVGLKTGQCLCFTDYYDDNIHSFQNFALENMPLLLDSKLDPVIAKYPLDGEQKIFFKNDMKTIVTSCQNQIMEDYKQGNGNEVASQAMSETDKDFESMESGPLPVVPNYLPLPNGTSWSPGYHHTGGLRTSLPSMTEGSGTLYSSSPGLAPQTPNNPTMSTSSNSQVLWRPSASSSAMAWSAQLSPQVVSETHHGFVDSNFDPNIHSVGKLSLFPQASVLPHGSPTPASTRRQEIFKNPFLRSGARKPTTPTQLSPTTGIETQQSVPTQPQYSGNGYEQAFNTIVSPPPQGIRTPQKAQNIPFQTQYLENNYSGAPQGQYAAADLPPSAMGNMVPNPENTSFEAPVPEAQFFSEPNFDLYHYPSYLNDNDEAGEGTQDISRIIEPFPE